MINFRIIKPNLQATPAPIKMADIQREESFRTAIKNQKRRLSATKIEKRNSITETGESIFYVVFLVAKLLYKSKCPSVCMYVCLSVRFREKRDFLGP